MKIEKGKLEELLIANWTEFVDPRSMRDTTVETVLRHQDELTPLEVPILEMRGTQVTVSRFQMTERGFIVWVDFRIPLYDGVACGTNEFHLEWDGSLTHLHTVGSKLRQAV